MEITTRISLFGLMVFVASYCQQPEPSNKTLSWGFDLIQYRKEALKVSEIKINNSVPFVMNLVQFHQVFGQEDSTINAPKGLYTSFMIMDTFPKICRYICKGRSLFLEKGAHVYPLLLDLGSTPVSLNSDSIVLSLNTSAKDIKHSFPMSTLLYKDGDGNEFGGTIAIDATGGNQGISMWHLLFQGGFLVKIEFYTHPKRPFFDDVEIREQYNKKK
jgi:hypothetical protein